MLFGVSIQWKTTTNTLIQKTEYSSLICVSEAECRGVVALLFKKTNFTGKQSLASFPLAFFPTSPPPWSLSFTLLSRVQNVKLLSLLSLTPNTYTSL